MESTEQASQTVESIRIVFLAIGPNLLAFILSMASSPPPLSLWLSTFFFMSLLRVLTTYSERGREKERERERERERSKTRKRRAPSPSLPPPLPQKNHGGTKRAAAAAMLVVGRRERARREGERHRPWSFLLPFLHRTAFAAAAADSSASTAAKVISDQSSF